MEVNPSQMCRERFGGTVASGHPVGNFSHSPWVTGPHRVADTAPQAPLTFGLTGCSQPPAHQLQLSHPFLAGNCPAVSAVRDLVAVAGPGPWVGFLGWEGP